MDEYALANTNQDVVGLLVLIQSICSQFDEQQQWVYALIQAQKRTCLLTKKKSANDKYHDDNVAMINVLESYGGAYGNEPGLLKAEVASVNLA